jgi:hypothetical protein
VYTLDVAVAEWLRNYATSQKVTGSIPDEVNEFFSIHIVLLATLGAGVYSASNRNEYQKQKNNVFWGVEFSRCIRLATLPPSVSRLSKQCGILNISQPRRPSRPVSGIALLYGDRVCFL